MFIDRRISRFAAALSATAGFVDAVGWLTSGGLFVAFMSGNVTKLGLGLAGHLDNALLGAGLIGSFVAGVVIGSLAGRAAGVQQRRHVLWLVTAMMAMAAVLLQKMLLVPAMLVLAASMGAKNTVFAEDGEVKVGLTYLTGALVRVGKRIATALRGGERFGWVPPLLLFLAMLAGATLGGLAFAVAGPRALWAAVAVMVALSLYAERLPSGR